jgi:hypothetical protein
VLSKKCAALAHKNPITNSDAFVTVFPVALFSTFVPWTVVKLVKTLEYRWEQVVFVHNVRSWQRSCGNAAMFLSRET